MKKLLLSKRDQEVLSRWWSFKRYNRRQVFLNMANFSKPQRIVNKKVNPTLKVAS